MLSLLPGSPETWSKTVVVGAAPSRRKRSALPVPRMVETERWVAPGGTSMVNTGPLGQAWLAVRLETGTPDFRSSVCTSHSGSLAKTAGAAAKPRRAEKASARARRRGNGRIDLFIKADSTVAGAPRAGKPACF